MSIQGIGNMAKTATKNAAARVASAKCMITTLALLMFLTVATAVPVYAAGLPAFIGEAVDMLRILVFAIGGGLALWGIINLLEGYGNDNPGAKSQGIKQLMAGGGIALLGTIVPQLMTLFS